LADDGQEIDVVNVATPSQLQWPARVALQQG
jgi:hypothetical protein